MDPTHGIHSPTGEPSSDLWYDALELSTGKLRP